MQELLKIADKLRIIKTNIEQTQEDIDIATFNAENIRAVEIVIYYNTNPKKSVVYPVPNMVEYNNKIIEALENKKERLKSEAEELIKNYKSI